MKPKLIVSALMVLPLVFGVLESPAKADDTIDASKITCSQFIFYKISNPNSIVHWLNGYYHGKRDNTMIDPKALEENVNKLRTICEQTKNYDLPLMQIIEQAGKR